MTKEQSCERADDATAWLAREHEERRVRRGETDVNYGASEEQVPAEGWIP